MKTSGAWIDSTAKLCLSQGDCGNYRNIVDEITKFGFRNSDGNKKITSTLKTV